MAKSWQEVAESGVQVEFWLVIFPVCGIVSMMLVACLTVLIDPSWESVMRALAIVLLWWPMGLLFGYAVAVYPIVAKFNKRLAECINQNPTADDPYDAAMVLYYLEHPRWVHRLSCKLQGLNYGALLRGCKDAQRDR